VLKTGADTPQVLLESLEIALDREYFGRFAGIVPRNNTQKVIQQYLSLEIDRINIRLVLSEVIRRNRSSELPRWLPGGLLSQKILDAMLSSGSIESALLLLEATPYRSIHQVFYQIIQQGRFSGLDRKFETLMIERLQYLILRYPFSGALFMHFLWRKWVEGANLRILARGIEAHLPVGRIREELVYA
jgi:vacuolar-type H+-ATPase subunit C/Vma6